MCGMGKRSKPNYQHGGEGLGDSAKRNSGAKCRWGIMPLRAVNMKLQLCSRCSRESQRVFEPGGMDSLQNNLRPKSL